MPTFPSCPRRRASRPTNGQLHARVPGLPLCAGSDDDTSEFRLAEINRAAGAMARQRCGPGQMSRAWNYAASSVITWRRWGPRSTLGEASRLGATRVKEGMRLFVTVVLLALVGADFGLRNAVMTSACDPNTPSLPTHSVISGSQPNVVAGNSGAVGFAAPGSNTNSWCSQAVRDQAYISSRLSGFFNNPTNVLLALFNGLLVVVGFKQVKSTKDSAR